MTQKSSGYIKQESTQQKGGIPSGHRRAVILKYRDPLTGKAHTTNHQPGKTADKKHREREKKEKVGGQSKVGQAAYKSQTHTHSLRHVSKIVQDQQGKRAPSRKVAYPQATEGQLF